MGKITLIPKRHKTTRWAPLILLFKDIQVIISKQQFVWGEQRWLGERGYSSSQDTDDPWASECVRTEGLFSRFISPSSLANKEALDLLTWKDLRSDSHLLTRELQNSIHSIYSDSQKNAFSRISSNTPRWIRAATPKVFSGEFECTSRKGFCGQLIREILLNKISHLQIY